MKKKSATLAAIEPTFRFVGTLSELAWRSERRTIVYHVVILPRPLASQPPFSEKGRLRMKGTLAGVPVSLAFQRAEGRRYLLVGRTLEKKAGLKIGAKVEVIFALAGLDKVDVPGEIKEAIRQDPAWKKLWRALTPGKQRGLSYLVSSAKNPEIRAQRAVEIFRQLEMGKIPGPPRRRD